MASVGTLINRMRYWCAVANLGYSQADRWNFNPSGGNCDCSSLVIHALREAGFDTGNATYTGNLSGNLTRRGWTRLPANGNPQAGDILLNDVHHVAVYLGEGRYCHSTGRSGDAAPRMAGLAIRLAAKPTSAHTTAIRGIAICDTRVPSLPLQPQIPVPSQWMAMLVRPPCAVGSR